MRRVLAVLAGLVLVAAPLSASAVDPSHGSPGFCPTDEGVTVVIDFQALGGTTVVRCAPGPVGPGFTGHSALVDAGIQLQGTRRWGEAFICRLEGRPGPNEIVPIAGHPKYKEPCIDTPPASGYWSYWWATSGGQWQYSQWGVKNRNAIRGGFEGWSFSLNATAETNPKPRITPRRPGSAPQPTTNLPTQKPTGNNPNEKQNPAPTGQPKTSQNNPNEPGGNTTTTIGGSQVGQDPGDTTTEPSNPQSGQPSTGQTTALPPGLPRQSAEPAGDPRASGEPSSDVPWTGGEPVADGTHSRDAPPGVPVSTVLTGFVIILLIGAAVITAQYRRSRRS
ncbi:hypothetical protein OHA18_26095 [Kribbella sp. NBC_00709]|uniref:hypothetical protein n=1 Tax=Kribbella sp. NBC_00709 TaxID=2975972 RepID=UPI002E2A8557|nr:hypothetical protein [Kribbella sp. NBC_00709]